LTLLILTALSSLASIFRSPLALAAGGVITTVAGTGTGGYLTSEDNGLATLAKLNYPTGTAVDNSGNLYIADSSNNRIRKVATNGSIITTVAGTVIGYSGDSGAATSAKMDWPNGVAIDSSGNLYIADTSNHRIRKVDATSKIITTVAGTSTRGYSGDNGVATNAQLNYPTGMAVDSSGYLYIADSSNNRIRKVATNGSIITTVAGTVIGYSGDSGAATSAKMDWPNGVAIDSSGNLYIADTSNNRIRKVTVSDGTISTVAGTSTGGYSGDNGAATSAKLNQPYGVAVDSSGNLYIADTKNHRIRKVDATSKIITTVAGTSTGGYSGDNGAATSAKLNSPQGVAVDSSDNLYIADTYNHCIRKVSEAIPPTVSSLTRATGAANPTNASSVDFTVTFSEDVTGVAVSSFAVRAGGATGTISAVSGSGKSYSVTVTPTSDGSLGLDVNATGTGIQDLAGNPLAGGFTTGEAYTVDKTGPVTTLTSMSKPTNPSNVATASFEFSSDDSQATFECKLDNEAFAVCTNSHALSGLADGSHTFEVRAKDTLGNTEATPASYTWVVDTTAPTVTSLNRATGAANPTNASSVNFVVTFSESVTGVDSSDLTVDAATGVTGSIIGTVTGSGTTYTIPVNSISGDGDLSIDVKTSGTGIQDSAGNALAGGYTTGETYIVDKTGPDTTIGTKPTDPSNDVAPSFTFSSDDAQATFECKLDSEAFAVCTSSHALSGLADGSHTFEVRAKDSEGNVKATPTSYTWVVDTTAPDTTIDPANVPTDPSNDVAPSFTFSSDDLQATFECKLDNDAFAVCTSSHALSGLADGPHTFEVRAVDKAGNKDAEPAQYTWNVTAKAPPTATATATAIPTATPTAIPTATATATATPTATATATATATVTPSATNTATPNAAELTAVAGGATLTPSNTPTVTPSATNTATPNAVELTAVAGGATLTPSNTPTVTPSATNTATPNAVELTATAGGATLTPSNTPTVTPSATNKPTPNAVELTATAGGVTLTPSKNPTRTASPTKVALTPSSTPSPLPTLTAPCTCPLLWLTQGNCTSSSLTPTPVQGSGLDLNTFYKVRAILQKSKQGQVYISFYEQQGPEITNLLFTEATLRAKALQTLLLWQPLLQAWVINQGASVQATDDLITADMTQAVEAFIKDLATEGSPALQQAINDLLATNPPAQLVGKTISQAQEQVLSTGWQVYLPIITR